MTNNGEVSGTQGGGPTSVTANKEEVSETQGGGSTSATNMLNKRAAAPTEGEINAFAEEDGDNASEAGSVTPGDGARSAKHRNTNPYRIQGPLISKLANSKKKIETMRQSSQKPNTEVDDKRLNGNINAIRQHCLQIVQAWDSSKLHEFVAMEELVKIAPMLVKTLTTKYEELLTKISNTTDINVMKKEINDAVKETVSSVAIFNEQDLTFTANNSVQVVQTSGQYDLITCDQCLAETPGGYFCNDCWREVEPLHVQHAQYDNDMDSVYGPY